jgi:4-alpha-glucanotransferase
VDRFAMLRQEDPDRNFIGEQARRLKVENSLMLSNRSSGILLHPTSLPGNFGVGDFGDEARAFVDFLSAGGQRLWQVLPLGPTGYGDSPYQSLSAFAGNTLLIDPRQFVSEGLLNFEDLAPPAFTADRVEFDEVRPFKERLLEVAYTNFQRDPASALSNDLREFCELSAWWLDDYALFRALKKANDGRTWSEWDSELAERQPAALENARNQFQDQIAAQKFFQFYFFRQWQALRDYCHTRGIKIIGDLSIFVAHDSADVWSHREYFKLDDRGNPTEVAGVPPDYFSETGQLWGNPLYDWNRMESDGFSWWIDRVRFALSQFDLLRVDHFRGFAACWEIPGGEATAQNGQWVPGPGRKLFAALAKALGDLPIIAENLGVITPDVESLREEFGFPGMRVLQFAFDSDTANVHLPHNYTRDAVCYTGTHDNDTTAGWFAGLTRRETREFCLEYLNCDGREIHRDFLRAAVASVADSAIVPLQDILGLGNEARMNLPASQSGNWSWRFQAELLTDQIAAELKRLTALYGR